MRHNTHVSIVLSIGLHVAGLLILAGVKLYTETNVADEMPVTFVDEQKTKPTRRSLLVRPMISVSKSPRHQTPEQYVVHPNYTSSVEFYANTSEKIFSEVKSIGQDVFQGVDVQKPSIRPRGRLVVPMGVDLLNEPRLRGIQTQPRISEGRDFLGVVAPIKIKSDINSPDDVLRKFFLSVRRKIKSRKRYPITAQKAEIEGRVGVKMTILKDGRLEKCKIVESSGYEILDRAALRSVQDASPFPPIPDAAKRDRIEISIHLVFKLSRR